MQIKVLGPGCRKCDALYENTVKAVEISGVSADVSKITDINQIADYGVLMTPGLVIDEVVIFTGKVPKPDKISEMIRKAAGS